MKLVFSSIFWQRIQAEQIAVTLKQSGVFGIEASPALFGKPFSDVSLKECKEVKIFWESRGLPIVSMQSLLYGYSEFQLFGTKTEQKALLQYLCKVCQIANALGATKLVFGSPKNRIKGALSYDDALNEAAAFFFTAAKNAKNEGCILCIEPNAPAYGCDFITTHLEAAQLVQMVIHPCFKLHMDTGVMQMNQESPFDTVKCLDEIGCMPAHLHCSEPFLKPVFDIDNRFHKNLAQCLTEAGYTGFVSIEMKPTSEINLISYLQKATWQTMNSYGEKHDNG